jgi:outer membrane protein insertion porin family
MLLRLKYPLIFLLIAFSFPIFPQTISKIEIEGNKIFTESVYSEWYASAQNKKYYAGIEDSLKSAIAFNLGTKGYYNASFAVKKKEIDSTKIVLLISVNEGTPTYIKKIHLLNFDSTDYNETYPYFSFLEGEIFYSQELENTIVKLLTKYENSGFPFAKIQLKSLYFSTDSAVNKHYVDVNIGLNKEIESRFDKVEIRGNKNTKDYVILRAIDISKGEKYSQLRIKEIPEKLSKLKFFDPVALPTYYINSKKEGVLLIEVKEKETNSFDGVIGYVPASNNQDGYLTGIVNLGFKNLLGTGRSASVRWQKIDRLSQEMELKYLEPWLINFPVNLNFDFYQKKQDSTYVQRKYDFSLEYLTTDELSASLIFGLESVIPTDNGSSTFSVYNSSSISSGLSLKIDTRNDPYAPQKGLLFLNTYTYSRKKINGPAEFMTADLVRNVILQRIKIDFAYFLRIFDKQILALGIHGRELQGKSFEVSDLYLLGGTNTLRGYSENQFMGSRILWSNLEYRFLLAERSFAFLFFDTGYYFRKAEPDKSILEYSGEKIGYGFGLNIETSLGVMTVSFGLAKGDTFSQGKIHFGLVNDF